MKPILKTCITKDSITFTDITGRYSATDNLNGWGTPNIDYIDVESANVTVTQLESGNQSSFNIPINFTTGTPEEISFGPFDYLYSDGIIEVQYTITDTNNVKYEFCRKSFHMINIDCCIDKLIVEAIEKEDDPVFMNKVMQAEAIRSTLYKSALCMNETRLNFYLNKLKLICNSCATVI